MCHIFLALFASHWGLPYNMPAHSLQRSQYVNGLAELTPEIRASGYVEMSTGGFPVSQKKTYSDEWDDWNVFSIY